MPELPEVETTRRGISEPLLHAMVQKVTVRQPKLRWPIPPKLAKSLQGQIIENIDRRGKYLLMQTANGTMLIHLGMSGRLRILPHGLKPQKHDHVDFYFNNNLCLRYTDPRRFGAILWTNENPLQHPLLINLGPEPLSRQFSSEYLFQKSRGRKVTIKQFLMDSKIVVGVGNIYATESLFYAGISPLRAAGQISHARYDKLTKCVKQVLRKAIKAGGTTLRDFYSSDGKPGYFKQQLAVYGREHQPCPQCGKVLRKKIIAQRSSVYCRLCQR